VGLYKFSEFRRINEAIEPVIKDTTELGATIPTDGDILADYESGGMRNAVAFLRNRDFVEFINRFDLHLFSVGRTSHWGPWSDLQISHKNTYDIREVYITKFPLSPGKLHAGFSDIGLPDEIEDFLFKATTMLNISIDWSDDKISTKSGFTMSRPRSSYYENLGDVNGHISYALDVSKNLIGDIDNMASAMIKKIHAYIKKFFKTFTKKPGDLIDQYKSYFYEKFNNTDLTINEILDSFIKTTFIEYFIKNPMGSHLMSPILKQIYRKKEPKANLLLECSESYFYFVTNLYEGEDDLMKPFIDFNGGPREFIINTTIKFYESLGDEEILNDKDTIEKLVGFFNTENPEAVKVIQDYADSNTIQFILATSKIWKNKMFQKLLSKLDIDPEDKKNGDLLSDLHDIGL